MKMFGDMSSMASLIAAAAMAASNPTQASSSSSSFSSNKLNNNHQNNFIAPNINYHNQFMQSTIQPDNGNNNVQAAALAAAAAFKYNSFYNSIDILNAQKQQQNYSTSLAKLMSYCYNKPADYMQRLITEQVHNNNNNNNNNNNQTVVAPMQLQQSSQQQQSKSNLRYHPYMKSNSNDLNASILKLHQQQQMTINTNSLMSNSSSSSSSQLSPALSVELDCSKKKNGSFSPCQQSSTALNSRSPSPAESLSNHSVKNQNISRPSSSFSSDSNLHDLKSNE
jgi:hypothetical protein